MSHWEDAGCPEPSHIAEEGDSEDESDGSEHETEDEDDEGIDGSPRKGRNPNMFVLSGAKATPKTPADLNGEFALDSLCGSFSGIKRIGGTNNEYEIGKMELDEFTKEIIQTTGYGNFFQVLDIKDDNGNHFVQFEFSMGWEGCSPTGGDVIAKKQAGSDQWIELSEDEKFRLGIGNEVSWDDLRKRDEDRQRRIHKGLKRKRDSENGHDHSGRSMKARRQRLAFGCC